MICILLVEDDIQFNRIVCSYLTDNGYSVVGCHSAAEALEQIAPRLKIKLSII